MKVTQSCLTLCNPMDRLLHPWDFWGKSTRVGCCFLLLGIFSTQDRTGVSRIAGRWFTLWATRETIMEKDMKKNMYITESPIVYQKLTQHCQSTLLQLKKNKTPQFCLKNTRQSEDLWCLSSKKPACSSGNVDLIPGSGNPPEKEMTTHSSILA